MARQWGRGSPLYESRVRGNFADAGEGVLFPLSLLEQAVERGRVPVVVDPNAPPPPVFLGVDVARSVAGDLNALCVVQGGRMLRLATWRSPDLMATVARVMHEVALSRPTKVRVDVGGVGGGVADNLKRLGVSVEEVSFGGSAADKSRFLNRRAELHFVLRELLERGTASLPDDDELLADLSALRYQFDQKGRVVLEGKDEVRARLGRSPDRSDALALAGGTPSRVRTFEPVRVAVGHGGVTVGPVRAVATPWGWASSSAELQDPLQQGDPLRPGEGR
jgi:hypothetical protein